METMKSMFFACALLLGSAETFSAENLVLSEDFESQTFPPSGWVVKGTELSEDLESGYAHWSLNWNEVTGCSIAGSGCAEVMSDFKEGQAGIQMWKSNEIEPFAGKYSASVWHNNAGEVSILTSPVFAIPETGDIVASFAWGGALCNRLEKGYENEAITEGPISEVNDADGTLYFEIRAVDAADWTPLAYTQDRTKWRHKYVSLADYAGKNVNMRWRFVATENAGVSSGGASLDEIFVGDIKDMPTLAVSEIKKENLTVYPNPTSDYVYWAGGKADVKVYDLAGNCIKDLTEVESVSLEGLASGMYIVSVSCGDSVSTARVMKR